MRRGLYYGGANWALFKRSERGMGTWGLKGEKELDGGKRLELHLHTQMRRDGERARYGAGKWPRI